MKTGVPGSSGGEDRCVRHAPPASLQHFTGEGTGNQWSHSANSERACRGCRELVKVSDTPVSRLHFPDNCQHSIQTSVGVSTLFVGLLHDRCNGSWLADA